VRGIRTLIWCAIVIAQAVDGGAQTRKTATFQPSRQIFERLFRECAGCGRAGALHIVVESPRLTDAWLARHTYQANGGQYGDNAAIADLWYDAVHRRLITRSLVLHEVDDPADLRLGRAPGRFPHDPDFTSVLESGTIVGLVGFVRWSSNGFGSYFAAMQGAVRDTGTGYLDLATVTGETGRTRSGSEYSPEDLVRHVRLHPSGQLELGYDTNPEARPDATLLVRGNVEVEGSVTIAGTPVREPAPPPMLACRIRTASGRGRGATAACDPGQWATGGGGSCSAGEMRSSRPVSAGELPVGWELTCSRDGTHSAHVICCSQ
jgi:hypothetical protein